MRCSLMLQLPLLLVTSLASPAVTYSSPPGGRPPLRRVVVTLGDTLSPQTLRHVVARREVGNPDIARIVATRSRCACQVAASELLARSGSRPTPLPGG